ncbi:MAG: hypothetical protein V7704_03195 [Aurantimonas endophytica]|uniref:GumC family protein n=1 Tax=Aurantimonas endophytica TaxID=1522175 RepID=UPI00300257D7
MIEHISASRSHHIADAQLKRGCRRARYKFNLLSLTRHQVVTSCRLLSVLDVGYARNGGPSVEISPISPRRPANVEPDVYEPAADLRRIGGVVRRQFKLAAMGAGLAALLALLFLYFVQPLYLSSVKILLDVNQNQLLASSQSSPTPQSATTAEDFVATQMAVIGSEVVAGRVARSLGLTYNPETERLSSQPASEKDTRLTTAPPAETTDPVDPAVVHALNRALSVFRVEKSMVIEIDVTDPDPALAEAMASAYGQAYLDDQLGARYESARNAATWLENRIVRLRNQSLEANAEVETFRKQNNLVATDGRLLSDQQLQQLNDRLSEARSNLTRATARETVFSNAVDTRNIDSILSQITSMSGITPDAPILSLRNDYLGANERYREVSARWGAENDQARAIRAEVDRLANQILGEAARLRDGLAGDVRVARSEVDAITNSVASTTSQFQADNSTLVQLRNLEQRATSYNALYLDYLTRYQEAVQQQTLSMTTGRQISNAQKANLPVFPRNKIVLALAVFLGAAFGAGAGVARELMDNSFRSGAAVERLGVPFLGYVARGSLGLDPSAKGRTIPAHGTVGMDGALEPVLAKTMIAVRMRRRDSCKVVGIVSLEPSAARSAITLLLARHEAARGRRVLLIDGDSAGHALTDLARAAFPPEAAFDAQQDQPTRRTAPLAEHLDFQATQDEPGGSLLTDLLSLDRLAAVRDRYDTVLVDLPPAEPISEASALAASFDAFVGVLEWGGTRTDHLRALLEANSNLRNRLAGAVVVVANPRRLKLYDREGARRLRDRAL